MRSRELKMADIPELQRMYKATGFHQRPFPDLFVQEEVRVVSGPGDAPLMAAYAKLVPEVTLICEPGGNTHPLVKLSALTMLHNEFRVRLAEKGYMEAIASTPPQLERTFGRHLQRYFLWEQSWPTYRIQYQKDGAP